LQIAWRPGMLLGVEFMTQSFKPGQGHEVNVGSG
jgi:hypothetical protein